MAFSLPARHVMVIPFVLSLVLLICLLPPVATGARILFVGRPDDDFTESIYQSVLIGADDLNNRRFDLPLPPALLPVTVVPFWQTSNASQDMLDLRTLCRDPQTRPHVALATTGSLTASVLDEEDVLIIFVGQVESPNFYASVRLKLMTASLNTLAYVESTIDALRFLNISSVSPLGDFSQFDYFGSWLTVSRPFLNQSSVEYLQLPFSEPSPDQAIQLRKMANAHHHAVLAGLNPEYFSSVLRFPGAASYEWIWVDGSSLRPTLNSVDTSFWSYKQRFPAFEIPRGVFAVLQYENDSLAVDLEHRLRAVLGAEFSLGHQHIEARDMVFLWACAISHLGVDTSSGLQLLSAIAQNSTGRPLSASYLHLFVGGPYMYRWSNGARIRYHILKNLKADVPNPRWVDVGHILGSANGTVLGLIEPLPNITLQFATSNRPLPLRSRREVICTFFDSFSGQSSLWAPIVDSWVKIATIFIETDTPLGVSADKSQRVKLVTADVRNTFVGTAAATQHANFQLGSICSLGPSSSSLLQSVGTETQLRTSFSTTSDALSNKIAFPQLVQFATPDRYQASAMADLMIQNGWINTCTLNSRDRDAQAAHHAFTAAAESRGLNLMARISFEVNNAESANRALLSLSRQSCRVVVAYVKWTAIPDLVRLSQSSVSLFGRDGVQWIFSEQALYLFWIRATMAASVPDLNWSLLDGSIVVHSRSPAEKDSLQFKQFATMLQNVTGFAEPVPFAAPLIEAAQFLRFSVPATTTSAGPVFGSTLFNAVSTFLRNTTQFPFRGPFGFLNISSVTLERDSFHIAASNYLDSTSSLVEVGWWLASNKNEINRNVSSGSSNVTLSEFRSNRGFTYYDGTSFTPKDKISFIFRSQGVETGDVGSIVIMVAAAILAVLCGPVTGAILFATRDIPLISASNILLLVVSSCGAALVCVGAAFWVLDPTHNLVCAWRLLFPFLGAAIALGPLAAKAWALRGALAAATKQGKMKPLSTVHGVCTTLFITVPILAIVLAWLLSGGGFSVTIISTPSNLGSAVAFSWRICASSGSGVFIAIALAYLLLLDVSCLFVTCVARSVPALFHEARLLLLAFANLLLVSTVGIVIAFSFASSPSVYTYSIPIALLFGCLSTWLIVHVWKIFSAIRHRQSRSMTLQSLFSVRDSSMAQAWMLSSTATGSNPDQR